MSRRVILAAGILVAVTVLVLGSLAYYRYRRAQEGWHFYGPFQGLPPP